MNQNNISLEKVIAALEACSLIDKSDCSKCYLDSPGFGFACRDQLMRNALYLLKAQECTSVEPKRPELSDETKAELDKMDAVEMLSNIADICVDWDGYRTANGLGGLINEIWAYARYGADKLMKEQSQRDYEAATEMTEYCERYEPTYNPEDGSL